MSKGSSGEKTEQPTPKKLRDARKKGQVARSQEIVSAATLFASVGFLWWNWGGFTQQMIALLDIVARLSAGDNPGGRGMDAITITFWSLVRLLAPLILVVIVSGIFSNYFQFGSIFSGEAIKPKLENVGFKKGFQRIFSKKQLVEILKSIVKIVFLSTLIFFMVRSYIGATMNALPCGMPCLTEITVTILKTLLLCAALAFIAIALLDIVYQRKAHQKSLMMTKQEVKREHKENEGDPMIKGQRKQFGMEMIMNESLSSVRKSTAVVVNPTHFAVAILYDEKRGGLPRITARGRELNALRIRTEAETAGVPVFHNVELARALFAATKVGQYVPDDFFGPIAEILVWVKYNRALLYQGPLQHGVIDMARGEHLLA